MIAGFGPEGAVLSLEPREYAFVDLALSYVLHGVSLDEDDFSNVLGMSRSEAEDLYSRVQAFEAAAREGGSHWLAARPVLE